MLFNNMSKISAKELRDRLLTPISANDIKFNILSIYFFRDLRDEQRMRIFRNLNVLPSDFVDELQQSVQIQLLESLKNRILELDAEISFEKFSD